MNARTFITLYLPGLRDIRDRLRLAGSYDEAKQLTHFIDEASKLDYDYQYEPPNKPPVMGIIGIYVAGFVFGWLVGVLMCILS